MVTACPHTDQKHYAKNLCRNCYFRIGRHRMAWKCAHKTARLYAKGKCHPCYLLTYNKKQRKLY